MDKNKVQGKKDIKSNESKLKDKKVIVTNLPNKLIILENKDKTTNESYDDYRSSFLDYPHPFRLLNVSSMGGGKSLLSANIILHQQVKPFEKIIICSCDKDTREWTHNFPDIEVVDTIPTVDFMKENRDIKKLLILDDINLMGLNRAGMANLDKLYTYCSSHLGLSIICNIQSLYEQCPKIVRRNTDIFNIWKTQDKTQYDFLYRKVGLDSKDQLQELLKNYCQGRYDYLTINLKHGAPYKLMSKSFEPIDEDTLKLI
jgi:hypothetical protein